MQIDFPDKLRFLFDPHRYKVLYGGRGGAKSWGIARALLVQGAAKPLRIFCGREIQKSIKDSVHKLLADQIDELGLSQFYQVLQTEIRGRNGTEILFGGLKHNVQNIKSLESVDIAWIEEAQSVSKTSWDVLIPTIRKEGSEIWVSFNPELDTDDTYTRFVTRPPSTARVVKVGWQDNPWFPSVLRQEMEDKRQRDPDGYLHVWEGNCRQVLDGAIYADEIRKATEESRITRVPYDSTKPVQTFWDLGFADHTSIWFAQAIGFEYRIIDFYQNNLKALPHYLQVIQNRGYTYDRHWLPHDAEAKTLGTGRSVQEMAGEVLGRNSVHIAPRLSVTDGINAARAIFGQCFFDEGRCADGIQALRRYRYDKDPNTGEWSKTPLHDEYSHAADAFRYLAVSIKHGPAKKKDGAKPMNWLG